MGGIRTVFEQTFKNIDDILHKDAGCTSELDYTEQSSWLLFLKYLDALEGDKASEAALEGKLSQRHPRRGLPLGSLGGPENPRLQCRPQRGADRR